MGFIMNANSMDGMNKGELQLYELLSTKEGEMFRIIPNIILDRHGEGTNQIDLLAITQKGIFVFEMKDYSGWIFGNEDNVEWTQMLNKNGFGQKKNRFRNPIKQNENHIKTVRHLLSKNDIHIPIFNVVVFGNNASLKDVTSSVDVIKLDEVIGTIEKYPDVNCDYDGIATIETLIMSNNKFGKEALEEHLSFIKRISQPKEQLDDPVRKQKSNVSKPIPYMLWIKIIFGLTVLIAGFKYPIIFFALIALLAPSKKRRRSRKSSGGVAGLLVLVLIYVLFTISNMFSKPEDANVQATEINPPDNEIAKSAIFSTENNNENEIYEPIVNEETNNQIVPIAAEPALVEEVALTQSPQTDPVIISSLTPEEETTEEKQEEPVEEIKVTEPPANVNKNYIVLGTSKNEVLSLLGEPDKIVSYRYHYKNSVIYFNEDWNVNGWTNTYNQLDPALRSPSSGKFDLGSSKEDIEVALGSPTGIVYNNPYRWNYSNSHVTFDLEWKVIGWTNTYNQLDIGLKAPVGGIIDLGSTKNDVHVALGSPTEIVYNNPYRWNYRNSHVTFDQEWKVIGWTNTYNQFDIGLKKPIGGIIDLGSTKDDVHAALGSPTEILYNNPYRWNYRNSHVTFNQEWKVIGWTNTYNQLDLALKSRVSGTIDLGSTRDEVLVALGSPTEILYNNPYRWNYRNSHVTFDKEWNVIGWTNTYDQLDLALRSRVGGSIDLDSTKDEVLAALGSPTEILYTNAYHWNYKNANVTFDKEWKVNGWNSVYNLLNQALVPGKGGTIDIGSSKEEVKNALGSPTEISYRNQYRWTYANSYINFDSNWKVIDWKNNYDQLTHVLPQP